MLIPDRVFVVTGAGSGIGRAVALELLRRGARVAAVDRHAETLGETSRLAAAGERLSLHVLDITDQEAVSALPDAVLASHGRVDGLLSIAGIIQPFERVERLPLDWARKVMDVNFWGTYHLDTAFVPVLAARPEACLVNVSSMGALVPVPGQGVYSASKAAVTLLTECLYAELRGTGVAVTLVIPGGMGTNIATNSGVEVPATLAGSTFRLTPVGDAAMQIVEAMEKGTPRVVIGRDARSLDRLSRVAPVRAVTIVAERMKALLG